LSIDYLAVLLDIGYSPASRDPALRDGILDIQITEILVAKKNHFFYIPYCYFVFQPL